ncbi:MAG: 16S rRNA (uracil(1498)-N(3))-methyltransferase [Gammaproteobacteria bacterium]|nr:16S rRNA (uracil(1498)-N(3))-methyltransferase [Gammaproteobacteria bacterium]
MRSHRVFLSRPVSGAQTITTDQATAHYLSRVLRLRPGAALTVFDGTGGEYAATLTSSTRDKAELDIGEHRDRERESPLELTLAQGIARGERMDLVLQKATELGVSCIVPLLTDHTVVRLDRDRAEKRHTHWQKIAISACEQCGRNRLPQVCRPCGIDDWLESLPDSGMRLVLQPDAAIPLSELATDPACDPGSQGITVLIGPEGGLSQREHEIAMARDFRPVALGPRILRTETAALAALAIVQSRWGDAG